jgi:hypothetical protein
MLEELRGGKIDFVPDGNLSETISNIKKLLAGQQAQFDLKRYTKTC